MEPSEVTPLFRFAFAPAILLPAIRHIAQRHIRRELLTVVTIQQGGDQHGGHDT
jgi:hypothetical protein